MKTTVLVFVDRENTSMGMRIASQEEFTQILIKNKELPLQERRLFTKDVIADTDGLESCTSKQACRIIRSGTAGKLTETKFRMKKESISFCLQTRFVQTKMQAI